MDRAVFALTTLLGGLGGGEEDVGEGMEGVDAHTPGSGLVPSGVTVTEAFLAFLLLGLGVSVGGAMEGAEEASTPGSRMGESGAASVTGVFFALLFLGLGVLLGGGLEGAEGVFASGLGV